MIDLHSHILPGLDDGPGTLEESLALARRYKEAGFSRVVATPHWIFGTSFMPEAEDVLARVDELNRAIVNEGIALRVSGGMEIALDPEVPGMLGSGQLLTLGGSPYVLIETPFQMLPAGWEQLFFAIAAKGYRIVMAHPERCAQVIGDPGMVDRLKAAGVYFQANYDSFLGVNGDMVLKTAMGMLARGCVDYMASDSHNAEYRHPGSAAKAIEELGKTIDSDTLERLTRGNPERVVGGLPLVRPERAPGAASGSGGRRWWFFSRRR